MYENNIYIIFSHILLVYKVLFYDMLLLYDFLFYDFLPYCVIFDNINSESLLILSFIFYELFIPYKESICYNLYSLSLSNISYPFPYSFIYWS